MNLRKELEEIEEKTLSKYACKSTESKGRNENEEPDEFRTCFQRDRDRIVHSKALRRLMHKTQVFLAPEGDHYRTRLTHTLEVSQIARTISKALNLNEDLTEAIALGHDLGHTPFGHIGEQYLNKKHPGGFQHNVQSLRVVDCLELDYKGKNLNLTKEVRDGIVNHSGKYKPFTLEGQVVKLSDRIAYINHDIDDAIRAQILSEDDIPLHIRSTLGLSTRERLDNMIHDIVNTSQNQEKIAMTDEMWEAMQELRKFMFQNVYTNPVAKSEEIKARRMIGEMFELFCDKPEEMPEKYRRMIEDGESKGRVVCDYISGMTDQFCVAKFSQYYMPEAWQVDGY